ncbi:hypothetical protein GCM10020331_062700 [Ectobacillus funiculus]
MEGREFEGIHFAMDYLTLATKKACLIPIFADGQFIDAEGKRRYRNRWR